MSYPRSQERELPESSPRLASSLTLGMVGEVVGEAPQATAGGTHPALFKRTKQALRSRSKVKPQYGQLKIRSSKLKFWLILLHLKHSRDVLYAGTGKTSFPLFTNSHSSTALSSEKEESYNRSLLLLVTPFWIKPWTFKSSSTNTSYSCVRRKPSLKNKSRLKCLTYSCCLASLIFVLSQFFERNLFLDALKHPDSFKRALKRFWVL